MPEHERLGPVSATMTECPVHRCPWRYQLTDPRIEDRPEDRMVLTVPPPIGVPAEAVAAGVAARAAAMAAAGPCASVEDAIRVVRAGAGAQDEAVLLWHLTTHTAGELRDTFPAEVLAELVRRGLPVG